jgi:hypothetical protein
LLRSYSWKLDLSISEDRSQRSWSDLDVAAPTHLLQAELEPVIPESLEQFFVPDLGFPRATFSEYEMHDESQRGAQVLSGLLVAYL